MFQIYSSNAAAMPSETSDFDRALHVGYSVIHNFGAPVFLMVPGKSDWALRFDNDGQPLTLVADEIPEKIKKANERED